MIRLLLFLGFASLHAYLPVTVPNGATLPYKMVDGVKEFHLVAEPIRQEFSPGITAECWGFNGRTPGPVIEAVEGDTVRIFVENRLPEATTVHWHGLILPNGMDGVAGLNMAPIPPGRTAVYEFPLVQSGTFMYHAHYDDIIQIGLGLTGFFIIHPREEEEEVDRDFVIMLSEWQIPAGAARPNPMTMDFNYFTFNGSLYPKTEPLVAKLGEKVRIRLGNLSLHSHPIHLHGYEFFVTRSGGKRIPPSARWSEVTVNVPVGTTKDIEFVADNPGDWAMHCHITHHAGMNGMGHSGPLMVGVDYTGLAERIKRLIPGFMPMGTRGMGEMFAPHHRTMPRPPNFAPWGNPGPHGVIELQGMFTILKVRENLDTDPGWYQQPPGTSPRLLQ